MDLHPARVEVGDHTVEIDSETHRNTLRSRFAIAAAGIALLASTGSACGGDSGPTRTYAIGLEADDSMQEYDYIATDPVDIRVGDEVTFEFDNTGALAHDLNVVDPGGSTVARAEPVEPGEMVSVTVLFEEEGIYRLSCFFDDHFIEHQMFTFIEVTESDG